MTADQRGFPRTTTYSSTPCVDAGAVQTNYALAFSTEPPSSTTAGQVISPEPVVQLTESGALFTAATGTVSISGSPVPLSGTTSASLSSGLAAFNNLLVPSGTSSEILTATLALNSSVNLTAQANVTLTVDQAAALTYPASGSVLTGSSVTFTWSSGTGVTQYNLFLGTNGAGSSNIYNSGHIAATSAALTNVPTNGVMIYARLWSYLNGTWQYTDYTFTESGTPAQAVLSTPSPGGQLSGTSVTFTWTTGGGPTQYALYLGSTGAGSSDIYNSGHITATSAAVTGLPANAETIYARLWSCINTVWLYTDYTYTAYGTPTKAVLSMPAPGTVLTGSSTTFTWTAGIAVTQYALYLGTNGGGSSDIYSSGHITTTSATVPSLPTNGVTIYARLWSYLSGTWQYTDYTYTESGTPAQAVLSTPAPGSQLAGTSATFTWTTGTGPTQYALYLGTTGLGSSNLFNSGHITTTSAAATGLPTNAGTVYARLWSCISGVWLYTDYTYTASGPSVLTSPTPGTVLGPSATFTWTPGTGATQYDLFLGTTGVGSYDIYDAGHITATSATVSSLPENGVTIYARLWSYLGGAWQYIDYTYIESGTPVPAALSSPAPGTVLTGTSATFSWTPGGATQFDLFLGTTGLGSYNVYNSGHTAATSVSVSSLPASGGTIYARFWWYLSGTWHYADYTYTASGTPAQAVLTTPAPGGVLPSGSPVAFAWTPGTGVTQYDLFLGTTGVGSYNLYNSGHIAATSVSVSGLPESGATVYARLWSYIDQAWQYTDYTYTEQ
jgi:hypothetical protein